MTLAEITNHLTDLFMWENPGFVEACRGVKRKGGEKSELVQIATRNSEGAKTVRVIMLMVIDRIWLEED